MVPLASASLCLLACALTAHACSDALALVQQAISASHEQEPSSSLHLLDGSALHDRAEAEKAEGAYGGIHKVPEWLLAQVGQLKQDKRHVFSFVGSMDFLHQRRKKSRFEILDWARNHFGDHDILLITDRPVAWRSLGEFDRSLNQPYYIKHTPTDKPKDFDKEYYQIMARSWLTLCPRGDRPWSNRIWEAALTRSVCVIKSLEADVQETELCWIPYKYVLRNSTRLPSNSSVLTDDTVKWLQGIADYNYRMVLKYQTFSEGDNKPSPRRSPPKGANCNSIAVE